MGHPGAALLSVGEKAYTDHRPCPPPVDGPWQRQKCLGDTVVPCASSNNPSQFVLLIFYLVSHVLLSQAQSFIEQRIPQDNMATVKKSSSFPCYDHKQTNSAKIKQSLQITTSLELWYVRWQSPVFKSTKDKHRPKTQADKIVALMWPAIMTVQKSHWILWNNKSIINRLLQMCQSP